MNISRFFTFLANDARLWQALSQWALMLVGVLILDFALQPLQVLLTILAALITQSLMMKVFQVKRGFASALITAFGISLLLRADNLWMHPAFTAFAIATKFTLLVANRPLFNPANLAVVLGSLLTGGWIASGQWGSGYEMMAVITVLGIINVWHSRQFASSLGFWGGLVTALGIRMLWLGEPLEIFVHHISSGALLLFAFFMMTDPRTTPISFMGKIIFSAAVGVAHVVYLFTEWQPNGAIYALPCLSLLWWIGGVVSPIVAKRISWFGINLQAQDWQHIKASRH